MIKELLEHIVKKLVSKPHDVIITDVTKSPEKQAYSIAVASQDRGKVIGRQGQTIQAIRALVAAVASEGQHVSIDIAQE